MIFGALYVLFSACTVLGKSIDSEYYSHYMNNSKRIFLENIESKRNYSSLNFDFKEYVQFFLFTRHNMNNYQQLFLDDVNLLKNSNYDVKNPTFFVIHGYMDSVNSDMVQVMKNDLLGLEESNLIVVDWSKITTTIFYHVIAQETPYVGNYVGLFVNFLINNGDNPKKIHIIGHSLGAQAAGFAGKTVTSGKLLRITGLDPALPGFENADKNNRLDANDADFVDCIHTCSGFLGYLDPICQVDFYPNGGRNTMPGCLWIDFGVCSHGRSHEYFSESIQSSHKFHAAKCTSIPDNENKCVQSDALMGYPASKQFLGIYYTETNSAYPYAMDISLNNFSR